MHQRRSRHGGLRPILALCVLAGCGGSGGSQFVSQQHIVYSDGLHNENTAMIRLDDGSILLVFRGGEMGQVGSTRAHINIFESRDDGQTFTLVSQVDASNLPGERDIRDPKLVEMDGRLFLYAISRLPGSHYRDLGGQAWTVRAESRDGGHTWTAPEKTYEDVNAAGVETFWGFWRFTTRQYTIAGEQQRRTLFATGYTDGDIEVGLFASEDGVHWDKRATIINSYNDVPSEAELQFLGVNAGTAVALVRLDNQDILANGQTAICTSPDPFVTWECGRRIEQRFDGPTWIVRGHERPRHFVFARKHLPCTFKRTAAYELRGDLLDPGEPIEVCEIQQLESSGDTAYTSLAPLTGSRSLLAWYSSAVDEELPWFQGISSPSDIWLAAVDFDEAPSGCAPPEPDQACAPPPLPAGGEVFDVSGAHRLTLAPVIWPTQPVFFTADVRLHDQQLDLTLQPLDAVTLAAVGTPWTVTDVPVGDDGSFAADFGTQALAAEAYPLLNDPFLTVNEFTLVGKTTSPDSLCGYTTGYAQVFGTSVSDRTRLEGSTFAATRIIGDTLPPPVSACSDLPGQ
jgi:hypothetical protein